MNAICFIDLETTGVDLYEDYPIQVGAVLVDLSDHSVIKEFTSLIRPPEAVSSTDAAYAIHGIGDEQLVKAPPAADVLSSFFAEMGTDYRFGGWNICFDVGFFRRMCHEAGMDSTFCRVNHRHLDVQSIAQFLRIAGALPAELLSLSDLGSHYGIGRGERHDALEDAHLTRSVCGKLLGLIGPRGDQC